MTFSIPKKTNLNRFLVELFVFLGPLGNILTPSSFPAAFRFYFFVVLFFPIFYRNFNIKLLKLIFAAIPFFLYITAFDIFKNFDSDYKENLLLFRCGLIFCQFMFISGASFYYNENCNKESTYRLIRLYLFSFLLSSLFGLTLMFGAFFSIIPSYLSMKFSVMYQEAYGIPRISPGSYPNEYGNISSFVLSTIVLIYLQKNKNCGLKFSTLFLSLMFVVSFLCLLFTTTRAAYISYALSLLYIAIISGAFLKVIVSTSAITIVLFLFINKFFINFMPILYAAYDSVSLSSGSTGERFSEWIYAKQNFISSPIFGTGFATLLDVHNIYIQILVEIGLAGATLLTITFMYYFFSNKEAIKGFFSKKFMKEEDLLLNRIIILGFIHIIWFGLSNHNLNHHLTWFVILLLNIKLLENRSLCLK